MTEAPAILVRPGEEQDLPALTAIYNHFVEHSVTTFDVERFTVEQRREWFSGYAPTGPHRLLVGEVDGVVAGYATSAALRSKPAYLHSVETTIYCDPAATGRGLGTRSIASSSSCSPPRTCTAPTPASPCPTRPRSGCTAGSASASSAPTRRSGTSWAGGSTCAGTSARCRDCRPSCARQSARAHGPSHH